MKEAEIASFISHQVAHTNQGSFGLSFEKVRPFDQQLTNVFTHSLPEYDNYLPSEDDRKAIFELIEIIRASGYYLSNHFDIDNLIIYNPLYAEMNEKLWQVNAVAFQVTDSVFIFYELIDMDSGKLLGHDDLYGSKNVPFAWAVDSFSYDSVLEEDEAIYPDVYVTVHDILISCYMAFMALLSNKNKVDASISTQYGYYVVTDQHFDVQEYYIKVAGDEKIEIDVKDLSTVASIEYYSSNQLGLVITKEESLYPSVVIDFLMYEVLKLYMLSHVAYLTRENSDKDIVRKKQVLLENELLQIDNFHQTYGVIENIRNLPEYKRLNKSIDSKIELMKLENDIRKNKYSMFLNYLLFTFSFFSALSAIPVIANNSQFSETCLLILFSIIFFVIGSFVFYNLNKK